MSELIGNQGGKPLYRIPFADGEQVDLNKIAREHLLPVKLGLNLVFNDPSDLSFGIGAGSLIVQNGDTIDVIEFLTGINKVDFKYMIRDGSQTAAITNQIDNQNYDDGSSNDVNDQTEIPDNNDVAPQKVFMNKDKEFLVMYGQQWFTNTLNAQAGYLATEWTLPAAQLSGFFELGTIGIEKRESDTGNATRSKVNQTSKLLENISQTGLAVFEFPKRTILHKQNGGTYALPENAIYTIKNTSITNELVINGGLVRVGFGRTVQIDFEDGAIIEEILLT